MDKISFKKGSGIVEILIAISIFTIILGSLITTSNMYLSGAQANLTSTKGAYIAQEGIEAIKTMRDFSWDNVGDLIDNTDYYLYFDTSSTTNFVWKATSTASYIDSIFVRTFKINSVYRDLNGRIVESGGILDANTKKVSVAVSWMSKSSTTTKNLTTYIADIL